MIRPPRRPAVMGILNLTPDSFSDGGLYEGAAALAQARRLVDQGADILDLGGRVALVTGAGQGVGRQVALQLADAKGSGGVVVNDYVLARAEAVAEEIRAAGGKALVGKASRLPT